MNKNLLVQIFVPTRDGEGQIATGYPVDRNRILTARHVLFPKDRDADRPIELRWYLQQGSARQWREIQEDSVIWEGGENCDAALIEYTFLEGVDEWGFLSEQRPRSHMKWESEGFARAGKQNDTREPVGIMGDVFPMADVAREFELGTKYAVDREEGWKGASGCPVFVEGKIIGVVITCPMNFNATRLRSTPIYKLLQIPEFRKAIGYDDRVARLEEIRLFIANNLAESPKAMDVLANELELKDRAYDTAARAKSLAGAMVQLTIEDLIGKLEKAHDALCKKSGENLIRDAVVVENVAHHLIPAVFDNAVIHSVHTRITGAQSALVSLPAGTKTVAEIIMAGVDKRPAEFQAPSEKEPFPPGRLCLPLSPEGGMKPQEFGESMDMHLINKYTPQEDRDRQDRETLIGIVADELDYLAERYHRTHYCIFDLKAEETATISWIAFIHKFKRRYPAIAFINLSDDSSTVRRERRLLRPLRDMLRRASKAGGSA
jgi:hypothetical protein